MSDEAREEEKEKHRGFTQNPHFIDDMPLTLAAHRLYCHIRRRHNFQKEDPKFFESIKTTAEFLGMSASTVNRAREELKSYGLTKERKVKQVGGRFDKVEIRIDESWWYLNDAIYVEHPDMALVSGMLGFIDDETKEICIEALRQKNYKLFWNEICYFYAPYRFDEQKRLQR